jgi:hypothetical protein
MDSTRGRLRNQVVSSLVWLWWVIDLARFEFESGTVSFCFSFIFISLENHICLSRGVQVAGAAWHAATRIVAGVGKLVQRTGDGRTGQVLSRQAIERSGGATCGLHRAHGDEERGFLGWALKSRSTVCQWFDLKTTGTVSHWFGPQNRWWRFVSGLTSKPLGRFSPVWPQKCGDGF